MKKKLLAVGKTIGSIVCVIAGLAIAGFGVSNFIPKKKYAGGDIDISDEE